MRILKKIALLTTVTVTLVACGKSYSISGTVLSKHGVPVPKAVVKMRLQDGGHSCCISTLTDTTDINGVFAFRGSFPGPRIGIFEIAAETKDSGWTYIREGISLKEHNLILQLK